MYATAPLSRPFPNRESLGDPSPVGTWRFMGTYNPKYKSTYHLLRGIGGGLGGFYKYTYKL